MAYGLRPVNTAGAGYHTGGFLEYKIGTLGTAIFNGGCVTMTAGAGINVLTDSVSNATTTAGVLVGARWINAAGEIKYSQYYDGVSTNTDAFAFVALASDTIFKVQGTIAFVDAHRGVPYNTSGVIIDVVDDGTQSGSSTPDLLVRFASGAIQNLIG